MGYEHRTGLTPLLLQLAAHYVTRGVGSHSCINLGYDRVDVSVSRPWGNHAMEGDPAAYFMEFLVEFYREGLRLNWVDFKIYMIGGGGNPALRPVIHHE